MLPVDDQGTNVAADFVDVPLPSSFADKLGDVAQLVKETDEAFSDRARARLVVPSAVRGEDRVADERLMGYEYCLLVVSELSSTGVGRLLVREQRVTVGFDDVLELTQRRAEGAKWRKGFLLR